MENINGTTNPDTEVNVSNPVSTEPKVDNTLHHNNTGYPKMAGFFRRFGAHFVDGLIVSIVTGPFTGGLRYQYTGKIDNMQDFSQAVSSMMPAISLANAIGWAVFFAAAYFYYGWFYSKKGQTPGKMLFKLKVVKPDLTYLDWNDAFVRDGLMKLVSGIPLALGYFWYFANPKRQTWHDIVAHSYVVQTDDNGNIYMDGQETYPTSKLKAFGFPCGCCLVYVLLFAGLIFLIGLFASEVSKKGSLDSVLEDAARKQYEQMEKDSMSDFDEQYNRQLDLMEEMMNQENMDLDSETSIDLESNIRYTN